MKTRSLALLSLIGLGFAFTWTVLVSQQALAQCAVGAVGTSCGSGGGAEKEKRATPTTNPALLSPVVNSPALVKPTPTGLAGNPACSPDPTQLQSLCAALPGFGSRPGPIQASQPGQCGPGLNQGQCGPGPQSLTWLGVGGGAIVGLAIGLLVPAVLKSFVNEDKSISYYFRHTDGHHTLDNAGEPQPGQTGNDDQAGGAESASARFPDE